MQVIVLILSVATMIMFTMLPSTANSMLRPDRHTQVVAKSIRVGDVAAIEIAGFDFGGPAMPPVIVRDRALIAALIHGLRDAQTAESSHNYLDTLTISFYRRANRGEVDLDFSAAAEGTSFGPTFNRALRKLEARNAGSTRINLRQLGAQAKSLTLEVVTTKHMTLTRRHDVAAVIRALTTVDQPLCDYRQGYPRIWLTFEFSGGRHKQMPVAINTLGNSSSARILRRYYADLAPKV